MKQERKKAPTFTSIGMHFVQVSGAEIVLVAIDINVRGLLAVHARRLCKSKRGIATCCRGTVRMALATPADREIAAGLMVHKQNTTGYVSQLSRMRNGLLLFRRH